MRRIKASFLLTLIIFSALSFVASQGVKAAEGYAKVYIVSLAGVGGWSIAGASDPLQVKNGAIHALSGNGMSFGVPCKMPWVHPKYGKSTPFYNIDYYVVTDWATYKNIIESENSKEVIIINTHGAIVPIPSEYPKENWIDKIAQAMLTRRVSWVHTGGYPFYYVWRQGQSASEEWGEDGFKHLMSHINKTDVNCMPLEAETEYAGITGIASQQLVPAYTDMPTSVQLGRPLKESDFKDYLTMSIYDRAYEGQRYYSGAAIAFAKPGQRFDLSNQYGFGAYIHIGTDETWGNSYGSDFSRGYVGTALAVWTEMQAFRPAAGKGGSLTNWPHCEYALFVRPVISSYSYLEEECLVRISFAIYGVLKQEIGVDDYIEEIGMTVGRIPDDCRVQMIRDLSKDGSGSEPLLNGIYTTDAMPIAETLLYALSILAFVPGFQELGVILALLGGIQLYSNWLQTLAPKGGSTGVTEPASEVIFDYDPRIDVTEINDEYQYLEFESIMTIELKVPISGRNNWCIIPLQWSVRLTPITGIFISVFGETPVAIWFGSGDTPTVFFEDFEDGMSGWSVEDSNPSAGYDYWGIPSTNFSEAYHIWCAWVGNNSLNGQVPNRDVWDGSYDKDMKACLTRSIDLRPYKEAKLFFELSQFVWPGDNLSAYYYTNTWEHLDTFTGNHAWQYKGPYTIPNNATRIKFEFVSNSDAYIDGGSSLDNIEIIGVLSNDAETQSDAGEAQTEATFIDVYDTLKNYAGYLEDDDWYKFAVSSSDLGNKYVQVNLNMPENTKFLVELCDPSGNWKAGPPEYGPLYYNLKTSDTPGNWTIKIYSKNGFGQYDFDIGVLPGSVGGCPFVYIWNGQKYVIDNNLLPTSVRGSGTDVEDFYRLEQTSVPVHQNPLFSLYSFQIREFQNEHSYLDQVKLSAVDHQPDVNIAVAQDGEILTYKNPHPPISCTNEYGYNMLDKIQCIDQDYYQGYPDGYLLLDFGNLSVQEGAKLVMRADMEHVKDSIHVQILNATGEWQTIAKIIPRVYWATEIINLAPYLPNSTSSLQIRLYFTSFHKLDYVGLDTTPQTEITTRQGFLVSAIHSEKGLITLKLLFNDQNYAELTPNQQINLLFALPRKQDQTTTTTFIFYTNGHYNTIK